MFKYYLVYKTSVPASNTPDKPIGIFRTYTEEGHTLYDTVQPSGWTSTRRNLREGESFLDRVSWSMAKYQEITQEQYTALTRLWSSNL